MAILDNYISDQALTDLISDILSFCPKEVDSLQNLANALDKAANTERIIKYQCKINSVGDEPVYRVYNLTLPQVIKLRKIVKKCADSVTFDQVLSTCIQDKQGNLSTTWPHCGLHCTLTTSGSMQAY